MKICFIKSAPKKCYLAFSGGVDSVVLLDLLLSKKVDVTLLWVNHRTDWCSTERNFVLKTSLKYKIPFVDFIINPFDKSTSLESFWSRQRKDIYQSMDKPVLTGLTLSDNVEWYIMSSMQGQSKIINYQNNNVYRPLIITPKEKILQYANENDLDYLSDPSNSDPDFNLRNKVRIKLIPKLKECFPGIDTTVRKLVLKQFNSEKGKIC